MRKLLLFLLIFPFLAQGQNTVTICDGDSALIYGNWQTNAGTYSNSNGNTTTLIVNPLPVITPNFILNGNATVQPGNVFQLTPAIGNQSGSVWNSIQINLNNPFHFNIDLFLGCNNGGADGIAFVLQPISTSLGSSGGGLGYQGISPSFAVEFDTWQNSQYADPSYDHIAIQRNGILNHQSWNSNNLAGPVGFPPSNYQIEDCQWHSAVFMWDPATQTFTLDFDGYSNVISYTGDIVNNIFGGNPMVYWGLTAATGGANNVQQFRFNYELNDTTICQNDSILINSLAIANSYTYLWTPNINISNNTIASPYFSPDTTTTYTLAITNSYGCTYVDSFIINVDTSANINFPLVNEFCLGSPPINLNFASPSGGQYLVNGQFSNIFNPTINNLGTNSITYNYTSSNNCSNSLTQNIEVFDAPIVTPLTTNASCQGFVDGQASLNIIGGTPPYLENWFGINPLTLGAGVYPYSVSDSNNCIINDTIQIFEPGFFGSTIIENNVSCNGLSDGNANIQLQGTSTPAGTVSNLSYCQSNPGTNTFSNIKDVQLIGDNNSINNNTSGQCDSYEDYTNLFADVTEGQSYSVTVSLGDCDGYNFPSGGYVYIDWNIDGDFLDPGEEIGIIPFGDTLANASVNIPFTVPNLGIYGATRMRVMSQFSSLSNVSGMTSCDIGVYNPSTSSYTEPWYGATEDYSIVINGTTILATYLWSNGSISDSISNLSTGLYTVTITNDNGCVITDSVLISEPNPISISYSSNNVTTCQGSNGSIDMTVTGGTGPYNFLWSNSDTTEDISNLTSGVYSVYITDSNGCSDSTSIIIDEPPSIILNYLSTNPTCIGYNNGSIDLSISSGTSPFIFNWSNNDSTEDIINLTAGNYSVTVTDSNGCSAITSILLSDPLPPNISHNSTNVSCYGGTDGSIDLAISGGTGPYSFLWSNNDTTEDITNLSFGTYTYTITDSLGCQFSDTATINQPTPIDVIPQTTDVSCANGNNGTALLNINGGTPPYTENWGTSNPLSLTAGSHTYIVNDDNGCNYTGSINIAEPAPIVVSYITTNALCNGVNDGTAILNISGGVSPYNEDWGTNNPLALSAGTHVFIITDTNGCVLTDSVLITQPNQISVVVDTFRVSCSGLSDGSASLNIFGGTAPYIENWGGNNPMALNAGTYSFTVTDSNNCLYQGQAIITEPNPISVNEFITDVSCYGLSDGVVLLQITGGTTPYNQDWLGDDPLALSQGNYSYTITDTNGCSLTNFVTINQPNELLVTSTVNNVSCHGYNDGSISLNISGGTIPYTENWGGNNPLALTAGTYNFIVTDDNGCQFIDIADVNQPDKILADYSVESPICEGQPSKVYINIINNTCNQYTIEINDESNTTPYIIDSIGNVIIDNSQILLYPNQTIDASLLSITDIYGCISQINEVRNIVVNQLPTLSMTLNDICESNPSFILNQANPTGGNYYINDMPMTIFDTDSLPTGDYIIRYEYIDPLTSCSNTTEDIISLLPSPTASFVLGPQPTDLDDPNIRFFNTSEDFTNLIWTVGNDQTVEDETDFIYTYTDTGTYIAQLIIINQYNCTDTVSQTVIINPVYSIFIPSSFTPNDDDKNEVFEPIINAAQSYTMKIYDRWGGIVYEGENKGWDGKNATSGQYFYSIEIIDYKNKLEKEIGQVTLIK